MSFTNRFGRKILTVFPIKATESLHSSRLMLRYHAVRTLDMRDCMNRLFFTMIIIIMIIIIIIVVKLCVIRSRVF